MNADLRALVHRRAGFRCEYCGLPGSRAVVPLHTEHIIARKHGGPTISSNLAAACHHCNLHKQTDLVGLDSRTGRRSALFNPRRHKWRRHFRWDGFFVIGRTPVGRATVAVLAMNDDEMVEVRQTLAEEGVFPW